MRSVEPDEDWRWCYTDELLGLKRSRPVAATVHGPFPSVGWKGSRYREGPGGTGPAAVDEKRTPWTTKTSWSASRHWWRKNTGLRESSNGPGGAGTGGPDVLRLQQLEEQLDQCWDLLRQRRAKKDYGENPDEAEVRPVGEVEGYQS